MQTLRRSEAGRRAEGVSHRSAGHEDNAAGSHVQDDENDRDTADDDDFQHCLMCSFLSLMSVSLHRNEQSTTIMTARAMMPLC